MKEALRGFTPSCYFVSFVVDAFRALPRYPGYTRISRGATRPACETSYENRERGGNARDRSRHFGAFRSTVHHLDGERRLGRSPFHTLRLPASRARRHSLRQEIGRASC